MSNKKLKIYNPNIQYYANIIIKKDINEDIEKEIHCLCSLFIELWGAKTKLSVCDISHFHRDMILTFTALDKFFNNESLKKELEDELKNETDENIIEDIKKFNKFCENIKILKDIQIESLSDENFTLKPIFKESIDFLAQKNKEINDFNNSLIELTNTIGNLERSLIGLQN